MIRDGNVTEVIGLDGTSCIEVIAPANSYLSNSALGNGWVCNRGYREKDGKCSCN